MGDGRVTAADRLAFLILTHPALGDDALRKDAMEDLRCVGPDGWQPPADADEAKRRWEASWDKDDAAGEA